MICRPQGEEEDDDEVQHERDSNADDGYDLVNDLLALIGEEHYDRVQQTDERPRGDEAEEDVLVPFRAGKCTQAEARYQCGAEGKAEEDSHTGRYHVVWYA